MRQNTPPVYNAGYIYDLYHTPPDQHLPQAPILFSWGIDFYRIFICLHFKVIMESTNRPADPLAKGTLATAKQGLKDLFTWDQRVVVRNEYGEEHCEWQKPEPLKNPISLFAQLSLKDWLYFIVGFLAWTADAFDFHALSIQTTKLAAYYKRSNTSITTAITLTLLLRSVGAAAFGLAGG